MTPWTREQYLEAARSVEIAPSPDGMCHRNLVSEDRCGHCSRKATIRAMLQHAADTLTPTTQEESAFK